MPTGSELFEIAPLRSPLMTGAAEAVERITGLRALSRFYEGLPREADEPFLATVQRGLGLSCDATDEDLARIPRSGPVVVVANHPFGAAEGIVLTRLLGTIRPDVRVLANHLLGRIPELRNDFILVDPFNIGTASRNVSGLRQALAHLAKGGMLVTFPAGTVSHLHLDRMSVTDPAWSPTIARLLRKTRAAALPVYFPGANGPLFHLAGIVHPALRTALLPHALLGQRNRRLEIRIGRAIPWSRLAELERDEEVIEHLQRRTYILRHRLRNQNDARAKAATPATSTQAPVAAATPSHLLAREVDALPADSRLASSGDLDVILACADRIPHVLNEIGRLREITFRSVGEGTGNASDLDSFDAYYQHLFLWNRETHEIAGAYRLGNVDAIVRSLGISGLYTSTLFRYTPEFFTRLGGQALELGRSFVRPEYQKSYAPLLLLWKGIGGFVARQPERCILFGPASISSDYHDASRALMATYLMKDAVAPELAACVRPRAPLRSRPGAARNADRATDFEDLQDLLGEIENGRRGVPVLVRQYLNVGGRVAGLNVDRAFSNVLDALIVVDLRLTPEKALVRYLGAEGSRTFRAHHGISGEPETPQHIV